VGGLLTLPKAMASLSQFSILSTIRPNARAPKATAETSHQSSVAITTRDLLHMSWREKICGWEQEGSPVQDLQARKLPLPTI
jgi:hypothetical protein